MSIPIDDDESYLVPNSHMETVDGEAVWCKIGERGELEFVDWNAIEGIASQYDRTEPVNRSDKMLIAKLMWLSRQETLKELGK